MIVHNFDPVLVDFGFLQIRWYSIAYIGGIVLGWVYAIKIIKKIKFNQYNFQSVTVESFDSLVTYLIIGIMVGGRLGYVFFYNFQFFFYNPVEIAKIWKGGMSFHGGLAGMIISVFIFSKKNNINFFALSDLISLVAPVGLFFGRIANFINTELVGRITNFPLAMIYPGIDNFPRHPSQLYEALLEGIILFTILLFVFFKNYSKEKYGKLSGLFLFFYGVFRFLIEFLREPDQHIGLIFNFFSMGQLLCVPLIFFGLIILYKKKYYA